MKELNTLPTHLGELPKNGKIISLLLTPRQLQDFDDIKRTAHIHTNYPFFCQNDVGARQKFLRPPSTTDPVNTVLYYPGQNILVNNFHEDFARAGLGIIKNPAPSLLIDACAILTEETLANLGMPNNVPIAFVTESQDNFLYMSPGHYCSLELSRANSIRHLSITCVYKQWVNYAFLLEEL